MESHQVGLVKIWAIAVYLHAGSCHLGQVARAACVAEGSGVGPECRGRGCSTRLAPFESGLLCNLATLAGVGGGGASLGALNFNMGQ